MRFATRLRRRSGELFRFRDGRLNIGGRTYRRLNKYTAHVRDADECQNAAERLYFADRIPRQPVPGPYAPPRA